MSDSAMLMVTQQLARADGACPRGRRGGSGRPTGSCRLLGSAALEAVQVAAGVAHGAVTVNGKLWDAAAPAAILLEAGGVITDLQGRPVFPFDLTRYRGREGAVPRRRACGTPGAAARDHRPAPEELSVLSDCRTGDECSSTGPGTGSSPAR
jgi:fructose-1,6-bisphosphatase/inositol monophosphatase family enzyme